MMRHRLATRLAGERGFTLLEVLVVLIVIGILAGLALAVFLNQRDKASDAKAKSNVDNVSRVVQACNAEEERDDYTQCVSVSELGEKSLPIDSAPATLVPSGNCPEPTGTETVDDPFEVRIFAAGKKCFVILGVSASGNRFWFVKDNNGIVLRGCSTPGTTGCPSSGLWG